MAPENLEYLDESGINRTAANVLTKIAELKAQIDEELISLSGVYPNMTAGTLVGADETSQWAQRTSACNGGVIVRSVQGATDVQGGALVPVHIAGIATTDANGNALDSIDWQAQTLRAAGSVADMLYSDHVETRVGVVDLGTLTWVAYKASTYPNLWYANIPERANLSATTSNDTPWNGYPKNTLSYRSSWKGLRDNDKSWTIYPVNSSYPKRIWINDSDYAGLTGAQVASALSGKIAFFELATPTTQPISPALPMTYRVQAGGSESIIVPSGETSAAPIITTANPSDIGSIIANGAVTTPKIANGAITGDKLASNAVTGTKIAENTVSGNKIAEGTIQETNLSQGFLNSLVYSNPLATAGSTYITPYFRAASVAAAQALTLIGIPTSQLIPNEISMETPILQDIRFRLVWLNDAELDSGNVFYSANTGTGVVTLFAIGRTSKCTGVMGVDTSWTVTSI